MLLRKSSSSSQFPLSLFFRTDADARSSRVIPPKRRRDHDDAWQNRTSTRTPAFTVSLLPANGPISGLPRVSANSPSSIFAPRATAAVSLPACKQEKSGRSFHAHGPHSLTPALIAASCAVLISRP